MAAPQPKSWQMPNVPNPLKNPLGFAVATAPVPFLLDASGAGSAVSGVQKAVSAAEFLQNPKNWVRIGEALVGLVLITVGVSAMLKGTPVGKAAGGAAGLAFAPLKAEQGIKYAAKRSGAIESAKLSARAAAKQGG